MGRTAAATGCTSYFVHYRDGRGAETQVFTSRYWPLTRARLEKLLEKAGFTEVVWHEPDAFTSPSLTVFLCNICA